MNTMAKHVIWDFNGTLLDDVALAVWCDNQVFAEMDLPPISMETYRREMRVPLTDFYHGLGVDLQRYPYEEINLSFQRLFAAHFDRAPLREGALDTLQNLQETGLTQSIVSATYEPALLTQTDSLGLTPWMQRITGLLDQLAGHKKDRAGWHMDHLSLQPKDVVLVGDTLGDAELAAHLGCRCILLAGGHTDAARLGNAGYPLVQSMAEIAALLMEDD